MKQQLKLLLLLSILAGPVFAAVYNASPPIVAHHGQVITVWSAETPTPGNGTTAASQQVVLTPSAGGDLTPFAIDGKFSGDPGAFEVDVQAAAVDADTNYQTVLNGSMTTVDSTNFTFHFDGTLVQTKFVRLLMRSRANAVTVTATVSR